MNNDSPSRCEHSAPMCVECVRTWNNVIEISGGAAMATLVVPLALEFGPVLIQWAMKIYERYSQDPQTPAEKRASYADIATRLDAANTVVQQAPQPNPGSGR